MEKGLTDLETKGLTEEEKREKYTEYLLAEKTNFYTNQSNNDKKKKGKALRNQRRKIGLKDFVLIRIIGKGAFGEVRIVREQHSKKVYAMKTMRKKDMIAKNQATHVEAERNLMAGANSPWLVKLYYSFQDDTYLYLVMEFCGGGDLMGVLMKQDILSEKTTRFYMTELAAAINAVHELDFVHRFAKKKKNFFFFFSGINLFIFFKGKKKKKKKECANAWVDDLKPDNILIANNGHIKLSDFGLAKSFRTENDEVISQYQQKAESLQEAEAEADKDEKDNADTSENTQATRAKYKERDRALMFSTVGTPDYIAPESSNIT
ncbi:Serine/threonine-protein kinase CBK1 [Reticulomyxa filosa]|uniref:non-specific serine/threonine protein kinase n=1 Tax=Reticulomyxa filosa TaxID=46433 RepID=X6NYP9_RETFI|nr:Serine/threonine-protein kinase CBK1 [Reticulomyxa filosa]|eukprot:ETO30964.1 Serine/threonine-protein kinase CBK1 [Reticulomyxa filosa]